MTTKAGQDIEQGTLLHLQVHTWTATVVINIQSSENWEAVYLQNHLYHCWICTQKILPEGHFLKYVHSDFVHNSLKLLYLWESVWIDDSCGKVPPLRVALSLN